MRLLKGNLGKRSINTREPRPALKCPWCPRWLSPAAKGIWKETVPVLKAMRILTRVDRDALAVYCQIYARWMAAENFLQQHGEVYPLRDEKGNVRCMQQFPQVAIARSLLQVVQSYQQEFGMTPSARTRVHEIPGLLQDDEDEWFLTGPRSAPPPPK